MGTIANRGVFVVALGVAACAGRESLPRDAGVVLDAPQPSDAGLAPDIVAPPTTRCELSTPVWPERSATPPQWGSGQTFTYAVSEMTVDAFPEDRAPIAGFDLDGRFNTELDESACGMVDIRSPLECENNCSPSLVSRDGVCARAGCEGADCRGGVDNNLPILVALLGALRSRDFAYQDVRPFIERAYRTGQAALVVQVSGVDDITQDDLVAVRVIRVVPAYVALPASACNAALLDQRYAVASRAVVNGDPTRPIVRDGVGRIHRGVLRARFNGEIHVPFIDGGPSIRDWPIESAQFAINLTQEGGTAGNLGGAITVQTLLPSFGTMPEPDQIGRFLGSIADLPDSTGTCVRFGGCVEIFGRISIGVHFSLVRAVLEPRVLDAPPIGACPSTPLVPRDDGGVYERFDASSFCRR